MEYHSFLFWRFKMMTRNEMMEVSVSLRSYIHSYDDNMKSINVCTGIEFPSPYGVSFILIQIVICEATGDVWKFPSPYGVSFILMGNEIYLSSSFIYKVSVSLWSIIHSYDTSKILDGMYYLSFRLLMEYHSFLFEVEFSSYTNVSDIVSVSLRSYIHSYLLQGKQYVESKGKFPSPYGVIFILIF